MVNGDFMIRMIVTDLDGTLYSDIENFDINRFYRIYEKLKKLNIRFVVASGNQYHLIKELFKDIIDEISVISENGSLILENDQEIYATSLNKEELYRLCDGLSQYRVPYLICGKRSAYVLKRNGIDEFKDPKHFPKIEMIEKVEDIDDHILKISFNDHFYEGNDIKKTVNSIIGDDMEIIATGFTAYDIITKGINKTFGVRMLAQRYHLSKDEIMAFGDSDNDIGMLRYVGHPYIMANARKEYRDMFDKIAPDAKDEGVLKVLEDFIQHQS